MPIIITKNGKEAKKITESNFVNEDGLQNFIYENPDSVPLYEIDEDIRLLILAREVPTRSGPIDAIGIDANGEVYIIETKLYKNPDKRLVVAQVLDYGASISENIDNELEFFQAIEDKVNSHYKMSLADKLNSFYELSTEESSEIIEIFRENLANGKLRFVVLMDRLEKRLKDLITFLNRNCRFDIYGVELEFYKYGDFEITIPKLFGSEIKKEVSNKSGSSKKRKWNEDSFFEELSNNLDQKEVETIKDFYRFFLKHSYQIRWGTGALNGSFNPVFTKIGPKSLLTVFTDGTLQLNYAWFIENEQQLKFKEKYRELFGRLYEMPPEDNHAKYPTYPITEWRKKTKEIQRIIIELIKNE